MHVLLVSAISDRPIIKHYGHIIWQDAEHLHMNLLKTESVQLLETY